MLVSTPLISKYCTVLPVCLPFTPQSGDYQELRTSFTGSTFQPHQGDLATRPLPSQPTTPAPAPRALAYTPQGEPVLVAELI